MKKNLRFYVVVLIVFSGVAITFFFNSDYYYARKLVYAIRAENVEAVEEILEKRPGCVNIYPQTGLEKIFNTITENRGLRYPLMEACLTDNIELIDMLVKAGADTNCSAGFTPLSITYLCKEENWYQISLYLIEHGASLDYATEYSGGKSTVLEDIVHPRSGGANPDYIPESETEVFAAFYYAVEHCNHDKVDWMHVLQESVTFDKIEIVQFLLDEGYCDVNDINSSNMTALMFAARDSTPDMVQLLLDRGADKNCVDSHGKTAFDYANEKGKADIIEVFNNYDS